MPGMEQNTDQTQANNQTQGKADDKTEYWKAEAKKAFEDRDAAKESARQVQTELAKYREAEQKIAQEKAQREEAEKRSKMEQEGKYAELLKMTEQKAEEKVKQAFSTYTKRVIPLAIKDAAKGIGNLTKEALDDLPTLLRDSIQIDPETLEAFPINEKGERLTDEKLQPVGMDKYITDFISKRSYMLTSSTPKGHGINGGKGTPMTYDEALANPTLMKQWMDADMDGFMQAQKAYFSAPAIAARSKASRKAQ